MNNSLEQGNGGAFITPSARRSIHSHLCCPFADSNNMVRYGLKTTDKTQEHDTFSETDDVGVDEVDNIISKPLQPISPPAKSKEKSSKKSKKRRNSLHTDDDDDDIDNLSKSVPATLPSHSYSSDDNKLWSSYNQNTSVGSYHSASTTPNNKIYNGVNRSYDRNASLNYYEQKTITSRIHNEIEDSGNTNYVKLLYPVIAVAVAIAIYVYFANTSRNGSSDNNYDEIMFYKDMSSLGQKYNVGSDPILQVQSGISTIFKRKDAGSFMFVYDSGMRDFDISVFNNFINDVSNAAAKYLRNDSAPVHYIELDGSKLEMKEHSELITKFREDLARTGVMLVKHVDTVPSALAMAFHYYCDEYDPLVEKSAIFFTLNLAECAHIPGQKSTHAHVEKCLASKWTNLPPDNIAPLLTRVINVVIDVTSVL